MKLALVELNATHQEVLLPQLHIAVSAGHEVTVFATASFLERLDARQACEVSKVRFVTIPEQKKGLSRWFGVAALRRLILSTNPDTVVINTLAGPWVPALCQSLRGKTRLVGILHNTLRLQNSRSVRSACTALDTLMVLSDELLHHLPQDSATGSQTQVSFYPLHWWQRREVLKEETARVVVPGQVEFKRRDYPLLLRELTEQTSATAGLKIEWVLLGPSRHRHGDGEKIVEALSGKPAEVQVKLWRSFLTEEEFWQELRAADLILPLVTPQTPQFDSYLRHQITGAHNLAFSLGTPMLIHQAFAQHSDFQSSCFFYGSEKGSLLEVTRQALADVATRKKHREQLLCDERFRQQNVSEKYLQEVWLR